MPTIPDKRALGEYRINGRANPASINPNVAYDIGRAGAAMKQAFDEIAGAFAGLGAKQQAMEDQTWLAQAKIDTLQADDTIRRETEMGAGPDGTGYEQAPMRFKSSIEEIEKRPGGSTEARTRYKLWAAEQGFETGRWAVNTAQKRLKEHTEAQLDRRLDTLTGLAESNPERAEEYLKAYDEEIDGYTGTAISVQDAAQRKISARSLISKTSIVARAIAKPADFGKALKVIEGDQATSSSKQITDRLEEDSGATDSIGRAAREVGVSERMLRTFSKIESGNNPRAQTGSYKGRFQLSQAEFEKHGGTGNIFDDDQNTFAAARKLKAEAAQFEAKYGRAPTTLDLYMIHQQGEAGYGAHMKNPDGIAWENVRPFYSDSAAKAKGFADGDAYAKAAIWGNIPRDQRRKFGSVDNVTSQDFVDMWGQKVSRLGGESTGTVTTGGASEPQPKATGLVEGGNIDLDKRKVLRMPDGSIKTEESISIGTDRGEALIPTVVDGKKLTDEEAIRHFKETGEHLGIFKTPKDADKYAQSLHERQGRFYSGGQVQTDPDKLPTVNGTIQPSEILKLTPEDRRAVLRELKPHLEEETKRRMQSAVSSLAAKGSQDIITEGELDDLSPLIGPKTVGKWKEALTEGKVLFDIQKEVKSMTAAEREERLRELVPTGNPDDLADKERLRYETWRKTMDQIQAQLKKDPIGYLGTENESGRQAMKQIVSAPADESGTPAREAAIDTLLNLQKREGLHPSDWQILGEKRAAQVVQAFSDAKSGPAAMATVEGLRQAYGRHFNRIWGELVKAGAPNAFRALPTATRQGQDGLIDAIAISKAAETGTGKDGSGLAAMRSRTGVSAQKLNQAITDQTAEFTKALGMGSSNLQEAYRTAIEYVALRGMLIEGKSLDDAVRSAKDEIFSKNNAVYRDAIIPREEFDKDSSLLRNGLETGYQKLIDKYSDLIVSRLGADDPRMPAGANHRAYLDSIKNYPRFETTNDMRGVYLIDEFGRRVMIADESGAQYVVLSWEELRQSGKYLGGWTR